MQEITPSAIISRDTAFFTPDEPIGAVVSAFFAPTRQKTKDIKIKSGHSIAVSLQKRNRMDRWDTASFTPYDPVGMVSFARWINP